MTIEELRAIQDREDLRHIHLVEIREDGFTLAHTDPERAKADRGGPTLEECAIHHWLAQRGRGKEPPGLYVFEKQHPDQYSESIGFQPYELIPAENLQRRQQVFACRR